MLEIILKKDARDYFKKNNISELTIDLESYPSCCLTVSEALVSHGAPETLEDYDKYEIEGLTIYVYKPLEFINDRVVLSKSKGWFSKNPLKADHIKQI